MPPTNTSLPTVRTGPEFAAGNEVEVKLFGPHFGWTWFEAVVQCAGSRRGSVEVKYDNGVEFLSGFNLLENVRPRPPRTKAEEFRQGDAVEAFFNYRWVAGNVYERCDWGCYQILFPDGLVKVYHEDKLRRRLDWVDGDWVAPPDLRAMDIATITIRPDLQVNGEYWFAPADLWATKNSSKLVDAINKASEPFAPAGNSKMSKFRGHSSRKGSKNHEADLESYIRNDYGYYEPYTGDDIGGSAKNNKKRCRSTDEIPDELARINPELTIVQELTGESLMTYKSVKMTLTSVWDALLSLDVFKSIPQYPHFRSLKKIKEDQIEGIALGHMANFAKFAKSLPTLGFDDSFDVLEERLGALEDFEQHGFNIEIFKHHIENLIRRKRMLIKVTQEKSLMKAEISQNAKNCCELNSELKELEDRKTEILVNIEDCKRRNADLERKIQMLQDEYDGLRNGFRSDWNLEK